MPYMLPPFAKCDINFSILNKTGEEIEILKTAGNYSIQVDGLV